MFRLCQMCWCHTLCLSLQGQKMTPSWARRIYVLLYVTENEQLISYTRLDLTAEVRTIPRRSAKEEQKHHRPKSILAHGSPRTLIDPYQAWHQWQPAAAAARAYCNRRPWVFSAAATAAAVAGRGNTI